MYHYIYQITNTVNNKIYIGKRSCSCLPEDDTCYMGSGVAIKRAIQKYGVDSFVKEVLSVWDTEELCLLEEARLVDENFVARTDTYNLKTGGIQGICGEETRAKISASAKIALNRPEIRAKISVVHKGKIVTDETRAKISASHARPEIKAKLSAAHARPETKAKISVANRARATKFTPADFDKMTPQKLKKNSTNATTEEPRVVR